MATTRCVVFLLLFLVVVNAKSSPQTDECGTTLVGWSIPSPPQDLILQQVIAVIRHGDRTPYNGSQCWPGDKAVWSCNLVHSETPVLTNEDNSQLKVSRLYDKVFMPSGEVMNGDCSVGQLTSIGYKQHLTNGHSLNAAYVKTNFLKPTLDPSEVHLRSDDVPRTLLSAQSLTLGMFPPDESNEIQHVPLYTRDIMYDTIEGNGRLCPKYSSNKIKFYTSDIWNNHNHNVTMPLINEINKAVGFNTAPDREAFEHFQDCLVTHKCHNLSLPNGMTDDLYRRINDEVSWRSYNQNKYPSVQDMSSVGVGFLLKDIWKNLNDSVNGKAKKFYLYSAHDSTLIQLLVALQLDKGIWPPYGSMMIIELYQSTSSGPVVRLIYNGVVEVPPFCKGQQLCAFNNYNQYLPSVTPPDDYIDFCK
jgi:acid phosphatase